jgi:hypothetical protein
MEEDLKEILNAFLEQLKLEIEDAGQDIKVSWDELRMYTAERANHLSAIVGKPGFELAVRAERDAIALKAGIAAVDTADQAGQRWLGMIQGTLIVVAKVLALGIV